MIFLRRESFGEYVRRYPVTSLLLAAQIVLFILMAVGGGTSNSDTLLRYGAVYHIGSEYAAPWRYAASIMLHSGFQHLLFNSFAIYVFAAPLERLIGSVRYLLLYAVSGIIGNVVSQLLHPEPYLSVGASGSLFGVYGAFVYIGLFRRQLLDSDSSKTVMIIVLVGTIYSFIGPHVNWYAHFGGLAGGFLMAFLYTPWLRADADR